MTDPFRDQLQQSLAPTYELDRELIGGGMSRVFVAVEQPLGRTVVVKVLPPEFGAGANIERFKREIQLAARLHHPHIVPLLSAGERGHILFYTMPFVEGESLRDALRRRRRFTVREVAHIVHDVVDALAYAHARGVIHRDIKPGNILLHGSHALVADFGVAKAISAALPHSGTTSAGIAIGTPAYMAPEQLAADPAADHRVDIYAVGLLAYELLTGDSPFAGQSPAQTMAAQLTRVPTPLAEILPDVPADLSDVLMRALAKDPGDRQPTADALLAELDATSAMTATPTGVTSPAERTGALTAPRRRVATAAIAAALLVAGAAAGAWTWTARRTERRAQADSLAVARADSIARATAIASRADSAPAPRRPSRREADARRTTSAPPPQAPLLTREDSMRIAEAVRRRMEGEWAAQVSKAMREAGIAEAIADSIRDAAGAARAQRREGMLSPQMLPVPMVGVTPSVSGTWRVAPGARASAGGAAAASARRVAFAPFTVPASQRETLPLARLLADSLQRALQSRAGYDVVGSEIVRRMSPGAALPAAVVGGRTGAAAVITGTVQRRGDSVYVRLIITDVSRERDRSVSAIRMTDADALAAVPALARGMFELLDQVDWSGPTRLLRPPATPAPPRDVP